MKKPAFLSTLIAAIIVSISFVSHTSYAGYPGIKSNQLDLDSGITLNQNISSNHGARIHIQYGEVQNKSDVYEIIPYCYFRLHRGSHELNTPVGIQATTFSITDVKNNKYQVQLVPHSTPEMQYAGLSGAGEGGAANQLTLTTEFILNDPAQPQVKKLVCAVWADPRDRGHLRLEEMQQVLGNLVDISGN